MATDDLKSPPPAPAQHRLPPDPWENWNPAWTARHGKTHEKTAAPTVHDLQEKNAPTETMTLTCDTPVPPARVQRRILDARLWSAMTLAQQGAALQIAAAYETMARGLGYSASNWERVGRSSNPAAITEAQTAMIDNYMVWARACITQKISHSMIVDILIGGHSCRAVDRDRRLRAGSARQNLLAGLSLYCALKGWR